jgi:putative SOS response-associated peptidase YedK
LDVLRWGLVPYWAKDLTVGFSNINAKAEGSESKPAFRDAFQRRRCLVPVDGFYEWKKTGTGKQPYTIALADRHLMAWLACGRTGVRPRASGFEVLPSSPPRRTSYALSFTTVCP